MKVLPTLEDLSYGKRILENAFTKIDEVDAREKSQSTFFQHGVPPGVGDKNVFYQNIQGEPEEHGHEEDMFGSVNGAPVEGNTQGLFGQKQGYKFGSKTFYNDFHVGTDKIVKAGTPIYAPTSGRVVSNTTGKKSGNMVSFIDSNGKLWRFMHLSKFAAKPGEIKPGQLIGYSGNTGLSTGPHVHIDISNNGKLELNNRKNFIDPDVYIKQLFSGQGISVRK